ncbi:cell division protein FtsQ/DivIB [Curvibacter sp. HBC61]|uniref:Cell division protein FtsQ/DivIB n=1 Tax=Curvibacter cyanobacteriorum TaxID=3026422 RepID=A0ABT5MV44_9BURK|nr:cell division protein FtsQ/DivIB [Curvibacter sp. HBC61]MDD0837915.1 cell division protein FtsQ/DivIB [Curvibacter sp. HBC61]
MSFASDLFIDQDGEPIPGKIPAELLLQGPASNAQMAAVQSLYFDFMTQQRLSLSPSASWNVGLSDGSRVRFEYAYGMTRIFVWPASTEDESATVAPLAYPAYVSLEYAPIYERSIIDLGTYSPQEYPPEPVYTAPEYTVPEPTFDQSAPVYMGVVRTNPNGTPPNYNLQAGSTIFDTKTTNYIDGTISEDGLTVVGAGSQNIYRRTIAYTLAGGGYIGYEYVFLSLAPANYPRLTENGQYTDFGFLRNPSIGDNELPWTIDTSWYDQITAYNNARDAEYNAAYLAWRNSTYAAWQADRTAFFNNAYATWRATVYQAWLDECAAIDAQYPANTSNNILTNLRRAARPAQLAALAAWLDTGIASPHLTARYLALPFNVSYAHTGTLDLSGGSVAGDNQVTEYPAAYRITYNVTNATRASGYTEHYSDGYAEAMMILQAGWSFGGDVSQPRNLFGWRANGQYSRLSQWFPYNYFERPQTVPGDLSSLTFDTAPGYAAFMASAIERSEAPGLKPSSDRFVPEDTTITLIQLEYDTYDPITRQWMWLPHVGMIYVDAIWLKSLGQFTVPTRPSSQSEGVSPRAVRVRRVLRQKRNPDLSWTTPTDVPTDELREPAFPSFPLTSLWTEYPTTIVAVLGLPGFAAPKPTPDTQFPHDAVAVFAGMNGDFEDLVTGSWTMNPTPMRLAAKALSYVYKVT